MVRDEFEGFDEPKADMAEGYMGDGFDEWSEGEDYGGEGPERDFRPQTVYDEEDPHGPGALLSAAEDYEDADEIDEVFEDLAAEGVELGLGVDLDASETPESINDRVSVTYDLVNAAVEQAIIDDILPSSYSMPDISDMFDEAIDLIDRYRAMEELEWEPTFVFVPTGLSLEQWQAILGNNQDPDTNAQGVITQATDLSTEEVDRLLATEEPAWHVALIDETSEPTLSAVSADGLHGEDADLIGGALVEIGAESKGSLPNTLQHLSPSISEYLALQWSRQLQGEEAIDTGRSATITDARITVDGLTKAILAKGTGSNEARVRLDTARIDEASHHIGLRPTFRN